MTRDYSPGKVQHVDGYELKARQVWRDGYKGSFQGMHYGFELGSVCKVRTQDPENFDEEVKSMVTAWQPQQQGLIGEDSKGKESYSRSNR